MVKNTFFNAPKLLSNNAKIIFSFCYKKFKQMISLKEKISLLTIRYNMYYLLPIPTECIVTNRLKNNCFM